MIFDSSNEEGSIDVTYSEVANPTIWEIDSKEHHERVFGGLTEMGVQQYMGSLFNMKRSRRKDVDFEHDTKIYLTMF